MNIYEKDIFSQADDMRGVLENFLKEDYVTVISDIKKNVFKKIIFTGMGSSYFACYNAVTILRNNGIECYAISASQLLHYELPSIERNTLVVIVSQSGRSGEIVELVEKIKRRYFILGISNDKESPLGICSDCMLNLFLESELSVSTRTYLAPIMLLYIFARVISGLWSESDILNIKGTIDSLEESVQEFERISGKLEEFFAIPPVINLLGRGYSLSTVDCGALFINEVAKYPSRSYDTGQFRHGPYEIINKDFNAFVFAPKDNTYQMQVRMAREIAGKGGKVALITDGMEESENNILVIRQKYPLPELVDMINIVPVQAFGNYIAKRKGLEVGVFLYSSKVTNIQ